ncbi:LysM peptidoglycan-binding domain-containing protein [Vibrio parahaemolyticus]|uniref:LysM peptidoglycan-binding domain-containing protein n=1 Tax=Vibrio parahaemolyticus TaxID=670 RepID=UPI000C86A903|nr:LysM domain-containing protein [Vibrio parahaemolyticus]PMS61096.1 peptidoglycan-binding protein [Vibrio parahaemolyticus]
MSNKTYVIKPGDTLIGIGIEQSVNFNILLELNPKYQPNPDLIQVGDTLILPSQEEEEPIPVEFPVEPIAKMCPKEKGTIVAPPLCEPKEIEDIIFATGESANRFYCLTKESVEKLDKEIEETTKLFQCYSDLVHQAPTGKETWAELEKHTQKREALCADLIYAGILPDPSRKNPASVKAEQSRKEKAEREKALENQRMANAKVTELKKRIRYIEEYSNWFGSEDSIIELKERLTATVVPNLKKELATWEKMAKVPPTKESSSGKPVDAKKMAVKERALDGIVTNTGGRELYSINRGVYTYVREAFFQEETTVRNSWRNTSNTNNANRALRTGNIKEFGKAIADDITSDLEQKKLAPDIKANLAKWQAPGGKIAEWKSTDTLLRDDEGNTMFAVSSEAQLGRWGMQAAVDAELNPFEKDEHGNAKGNVDLGVGASAGFSAFEAAITAEVFLPSDAGYTPCLNYTDANGQPALHSFGSFRFNAKMKVGCFVGVVAQAKAGVSNRRPETGDDVGILFDPHVSMGNAGGGQIGIKASVFGGGQLSGEFAGSVQWKAPENDKITNFNSLAEIQTEGNVSVGGGYNADFELYLRGGQFFLKLSAKLVWGAGGGGGFAVAINTQEIWNLVKVIWQGLQYVDYRHLKNINDDAYEYLVNATYFAFALAEGFVAPHDALKKAIAKGGETIEKIRVARQERLDLEAEAITLADRVLNDSARSGVPFDQLLPEAIGRMLDTLTRTFTFNWEEKQEAAICKLLKESTYSWHKFEEILARMNEKGKKAAGERVLFENIQRINAILDGKQQNQFNLWVTTLAETNSSVEVACTPFTPYSSTDFARKRSQVNQQYASLNNDHSTYPHV